MTLEEFRASRYLGELEDEDGRPMRAYSYAQDSCYIGVDRDGVPALTVANMHYSGSLESLEIVLYEWYLAEVADQVP